MTEPGAGPILVTERLRLVPSTEDDVAALHALLVSADVRRYLMDDKIVEREWVADVVEASRRSFAEAGFGLWRLESRPDGAFAGVAGLRPSAGAPEPQLLYALAPTLWGQGLATEAAAAILRYVFEDLELDHMLASTDPPNGASIRVMERLGMRFLEASLVAGQPLVFYRMTRAEWARVETAATRPATASGTPAATARL